MRLLFSFISLILLISCSDQRPAPTHEPYVIRRDGGGQLISAEADRLRLKIWGGQVEIRGYCASACVIFTTLPNACIGRGARIGFHGANINLGPIGNAQMARYLRGQVLENFINEWQFIPMAGMHWVPARDYVLLDPEVKICPRRRQSGN